MGAIQGTTLSGAATSIAEHAVHSLRERVRGKLVQPGDPDYDESRTIWNRTVDRKPALIVRCAAASDALEALRFATEHGLLLAVRGGGHHVAGNCLCQGGVVIDFGAMRGVEIDRATRRARVEPGALLSDLDTGAQQFGLVTPLGINSTTGVAGLTLGGGFGWLSRKLGLTIDNLISVEVITAGGERLTASKDQNADLFWGIRGGGGNFGVVTSFELQLHALGPNLLSGLIVHPFAGARELLQNYQRIASALPDEAAAWVVVRKAPPLPFLPAEVHGKEVVVFAVLYAGDIEQGKQALAPLLGLGKPIATAVAPQPYAAWQTAFDPLLGPGMRNYWKSHDLEHLSDGLIDRLLEHVGRLPTPHCEVILAQLGGAIARVPSDATAYTHRNARWVMNVHTRWEQAGDDERCIAWARRAFQDMAPFATGGVYVNFMAADETARVRDAYGSNYERLVSLKKKYDPGNLFRLNQNVPPGG